MRSPYTKNKYNQQRSFCQHKQKYWKRGELKTSMVIKTGSPRVGIVPPRVVIIVRGVRIVIIFPPKVDLLA
jgi:hypothetical protein